MLILLLQTADDWAEWAGAPEPSNVQEVVHILLQNDVTSAFVLEMATTAAMVVLVGIHRTTIGMVHGDGVTPLVVSILALGSLFGCACLAILSAVTMSQATQLGMGIALAYLAHVGFSRNTTLGDASGVMRWLPRKGGDR